MIQRPRGTRDILPPDTRLWNRVEAVAREVFSAWGAEEIRTPAFEHTELFVRSVGETTDIVQKEMYAFTDKGGERIAKPDAHPDAILHANRDSDGRPIAHARADTRLRQRQGGK